MVVKHETKAEAEGHIAEAVLEAWRNERVMMAAWTVDEKGEMHVTRTTWQFPDARLHEALELLERNVAEGAYQEPEPLPRVKLFETAKVHDDMPAMDGQWIGEVNDKELPAPMSKEEAEEQFGVDAQRTF